MKQKVEEIARLLPTKDENLKRALDEQVEAMKMMSDTILDEWIQLEEVMLTKIGAHFPNILSQPSIQDFKSNVPSKTPILGVSSIMSHADKKDFYRAKGYYDLGLYHKSYDVLIEYIQNEPDDEYARLFLAYSALFIERIEEALQHFSLLKSASKDSKIRAVCLNAIGIIHFEEMQFEGANHSFRQAIQEDEHLFSAYYNVGITYYIDGSYKEAIQAWEKYLELTHDTDLDLVLYLSNSYLRLGQYPMAMEIVQIMLPHDHEQVLLQLGKFFEDARQYDETIECYRNILAKNPRHSEALHGLGWNLWLLDPFNQECIPVLKKALSLDHNNTNIIFSLAWIYFHQNMIEDADRVNRILLAKDDHSPLTISLSLLIALQKGDQQLAENLINQLQEQKDQRNRALGDLFMGKLKLRQNRLQEALDSFKRSVRNNPHLKESYILQGFASALGREKNLAEKHFKKQNIVTFNK